MGNEQSTAAAAAASRPLGVAIVGCGMISTHHVEAKASLVDQSRGAGEGSGEGDDSASDGAVKVRTPPLLRVAALCDPDSNRRKIIQGLCSDEGLIEEGSAAPEYDGLEGLLDDKRTLAEVDVIFIAVPHDLHVTLGAAALRSGKHVVLEKPLAPYLEGCRALRDAARDAPGLLIVAEQSPHWEEIVEARRLIDSGKIGRIVSAAAYYYESMRDNLTSGLDAEGSLGWRRSLKRCGGGIVIDGGLHWIRPLRELCGEVVEVVGTTANAEPGLKMEGETVAHALFKIRRRRGAGAGAEAEAAAPAMNGDAEGNGPPPAAADDAAAAAAAEEEEGDDAPLVATFSANFMHSAPMAHDVCPYFRLTGTRGELVVYGTGLNPDGGGGLRLYDEENPDGKDLFPSDRKGGFFLGFRGLWRTIAETIRAGDREAAERSVKDGAADVAAALALYRSAKSGRWEKCETLDG